MKRRKWKSIVGGLAFAIGVTSCPVPTYAHDTDSYKVEDAEGTEEIEEAEAVNIAVEYLDGLQEIDGYWYYYENGEKVTDALREIDGYLYAFNYWGKMVIDDTYYVSDEYGNIEKYWIDENGHVRTNCWTEDSYGYQYYLDGNGRAIKDQLYKIGDYTYGFNSSGMMIKDCMCSIFDQNGDFYNYWFDEDGHLLVNCWKTSKFGEIYYLDENGKRLTEGVHQIGDELYGFNSREALITNQRHTYYDENGNPTNYYFDEDGHAITGWVESEYGDKSYFGSDGKAAAGVVNIDGDYYLFDSYGNLQRNQYEFDEKTLQYFYFGESGKAEECIQFKEGWNLCNGKWYYISSGVLAQNRWIESNGHKYYFVYDGSMLSDCEQDIFEEGIYTSNRYRFDSNGCMVVGWFKVGSAWYYYLPSGIAANGLQNIAGKNYVFSYGRMQTGLIILDGKYYLTSDSGEVLDYDNLAEGWNKIVDKKYYVVNGVIQKSQWITVDGIKYYLGYDGSAYTSQRYNDRGWMYQFDEEGRVLTGWQTFYGITYYYDSDGKSITQAYADSTVKTINGKQYYFSGGGALDRCSSLAIDGQLYKSAADGSLVLFSSKTNGWLNEWYYASDGMLVSGWKTIDGADYYFLSSGKTTGLNIIDGSSYYFDKHGKLAKGWIAVGGVWYWADSSGRLARNEWKKLGGAWYYFDNYSMATGMCYVDGEWNQFASNGKWKCVVKGTNKWISEAGEYYYIDSDGQIVRNTQREIDGKLYYFDTQGKMVKNEERAGYYYGSSGAAVKNQWIQPYLGDWRYYGSDGQSVAGWQKINKKWYYFAYAGMVIGDFIIDGKIYHFDSNGVWDGKAGKNITGWYMLNGLYYYNGASTDLGNGFKKIGQEQYHFSYDGTMTTDGLIYLQDGRCRFVDKNGKIVKNGWYKLVDGLENEVEWYYADKDGYLYQGEKVINGNKYYFAPHMMDRDCINQTGTTRYEISTTGIITKTVNASGIGWQKSSKGEWYYSKNGKFVTGCQTIGGKNYYFDYTGIMVKDQFVDGFGYFDKSGELSKVEGWVFAEGVWTYIRNGKALESDTWGLSGGVYKIEFSNNRQGPGFRHCNSSVYQEGENFYYYDGVKGLKTAVAFKNGWNKYLNKWYYVSNGKMAAGSVKIDGKWYYFEPEMVKDNYRLVYEGKVGLIYFGSDGAMVTNTWKKIGGEWFYFGADGYALEGIQYIDGVRYNLPRLISYFGGGIG